MRRTVDVPLRGSFRLLVQLAVILFLAQSSVSFAQEPAVEPKADAADEPAATTWEKMIYVPYKNLKGVLEKEAATVFMPYGEFLRLWEAAHPDSGKPAKAPVSAVISQASYVGRIENNLAHLDATYTIQVLSDKWAEVPLNFGDAALGKLTSDNEQVLIRGTGEGTYSLLLPSKGEHVVKLELVTRVRTSTEGRNFELEIPSTGITNFELAISAPDQTVEINPHLVSTPVEADANTTRIRANLGATRKISARWFPRVSKAPEMELLASVSNLLRVRIADGLIHTDAELTYQILRGQLNQVRIAVPLGHRILDVTAPNLKGWKADQEANRQVLTVDLLADTSKSVKVEIRTERPATAETTPLGGIDEDGVVHGIHALGAVRESGFLTVEHAPDLAVTVDEQQGLIRVDAVSVPEPARTASLYYKFYSPSFSLRTTFKPVEPRILVDHRSVLSFQDDELELQATLNYTIERAGVFELRYNLPEGLKVTRVDCAQKKEFSTGDGNTLVLTLNDKTQGSILVTIRGTVPFPKGEMENNLTLPVIEPLGTIREDGHIAVYIPESMELVTDETGLLGVQPDRVSNGEPRGRLRLASAWTYNRRPIAIPVRTLRRPTRLTATIGTTIDIKQELTQVTSDIKYSVLYAGLDTFRFAIPADAPENVDIDTVAEAGGPAIKQKTRSEPVDGWAIWTVVMQREVLGSQTLRVKYDLMPKDKEGAANILVDPIRVLGVAGVKEEAEADAEEADADADQVGDAAPAEKVSVSRIEGEIRVLKDRALSIVAVPTDLETIDVRQLDILPRDGYLAYRYFSQPVSLSLTARKHDVQDVVQTVVSRALIEAVVSQDDSITYRCRFRLKTSERQRLALALPASLEEILGVVVAGKQTSLEKSPEAGESGAETYFVNVARPTNSDVEFDIGLLFRIKSEPLPLRATGTQLKLPIPQLGGAAAATSGAVALQQLRFAVWVPEHYALVGTPDDFTIERQPSIALAIAGNPYSKLNTAELDRWIGNSSAGIFEFPVAGHGFEYSNLGGAQMLEATVWRIPWVTGILSVTLFAIAFVLARTTWENKLGILLLAGFLAALYGLEDADAMVHLVAACRYGVVAMLGYWMIRALAHRPHQPAVAQVATEPPFVPDSAASPAREAKAEEAETESEKPTTFEPESSPSEESPGDEQTDEEKPSDR